MSKRRPPTNKKRKAQIQHAYKRGIERYGVWLSEEANANLVEKIQNRDGKFICKCSNRVSCWYVEFMNKVIPVVYDKNRKTIVTVLPKDYDFDKFQED